MAASDTPSGNAGLVEAPRSDDWNPELSERLYDLLYHEDPEHRELALRVLELEARHGHEVYTELIYLLAHLRFSPEAAHAHWLAILEHAQTMARKLGQPVNLRVALLSYFLEVNRQFENPKILELRLYEQACESAYRDGLTGLPNYRLFREHLDQEVLRSERQNSPLSLIMIDVDNFKLYNDRNGHEAGNDALRGIAHLLAQALRKSDVVARYGGEEFAMILPMTTKTGAHLVAERARSRVADTAFPDEEHLPGGALTASLGVATYPGDATASDELIRCADRAMYVAKARNKNQVQLYGENRRSFRRFRASLDGHFCLLSAGLHSLTTLNISRGGVLFVTDRALEIGSLVDCKLVLPDGETSITASGRVVRVEEDGAGHFETAIRIIDIESRDRMRLMNWIDATESDATEVP